MKNDKKNFAETLSDIVDGDNDIYDEEKGEQETRLPFVTAEDLLKKAKENIDTIKDDNNADDRISKVNET